MAKIRKKYITEAVDERYYSILNNISDLYSHKRINDGNSNNNVLKSGVLSTNKVKKIIAQNSEMGTLPSNVITTGKELQSFNDPFDDTNILEFSNNSNSVITNSNVGFPLINLTDVPNGVSSGFYITTNTDLLAKNTISEDGADGAKFRSKFSLKNTKIFDSPNEFNNSFVNNRGISNSLDAAHPLYGKHVGKISNNTDEHILKQERFQEIYTPFDENYSNLEIPLVDNEDYNFYYSTVDEEVKENYNLGNQKQIKILLDFNSSSDLMLLNTKLTFNYENSTYNKSGFIDNLISTRYVNFLNGIDDYSYSSHFMPTAYWNFNNSRWNYLDGAILEADDYSALEVDDFPVAATNEIKYVYLGAKNTKGSSLSISPNFIFDSTATPTIVSNEIQLKHIKNSILSVYNKPILTTPAFRNDGSLNLANTSDAFNKTSISKITSSYGFPFKANWQPNKDHLLDMSKYIKNDFLLEKVVIKGSFTSRGEMPVKKGNYSSGYRESGNLLADLSGFNSTYDMKDDHNKYISNALTFFILNERKGLNHIDQNTYPNLQQSYFYSKELNNILDDSNNTQGKKLKNFLGDFKTYEQYQDTLKVYSQIIPNSYVYGLDEYNNLSLTDTYTFNSNDKKCSLALYKSVFHYLDAKANSGSGDVIDSIYYKKADSNSSLFGNDLLSNNDNLLYNIKVEENSGSSFTNFDKATSRELVSYSNMLIINKYSDIDLDSKVLKNIDKKHIIDTTNSEDDLHLNIKEKTKFEVKSFVKSINTSNYTDESIYKIKSNIKEKKLVTAEETSYVSLGVSDIFTQKSDANGLYPIVNLFELSDASGKDGSNLTKIFNQSVDALVYAGEVVNSIPFSLYYHSFSLNVDIDDNGTKVPINYLIKFSYKNPINYDDSSNYYSNRDSYNNETKLYLFDFIKHYEVTTTSGSTFNVVDLNLRFLDPWDGRGILGEWLKFQKISETSQSSVYNFVPPEKNSSIVISASDDWPLSPNDQMYMGLIKFIMFGLYSKPMHTSTGEDTTKKLYEYLSSEMSISIEKQHPYAAKIDFLESIVDPYTNNTSDSINFAIADNQNIASYGFFDIVQKRGGNRGNEEVSNDEAFYNINNVLEGESIGTPNNIGIISERIINKKLLSNDSRLEKNTKSKTGKILLESNALDNTSNISYLLKPEDRLVFGVSSNSNGEVMPTVVNLHDTLEITLIGRDYIDDKKQRTNESKSIRKTVIGDNNTNKSGASIYQTAGCYYDNIWDKSNLFSSLEDFRSEKKIIGSQASRSFGTYSGIKTFDKVFDSNNSILYKTDSVNPSVASVFLNCLNKKPLFTIDSQDRYNYRNNTTTSRPSYKILLSDNIKASRLTSFPNRYKKVVFDWHKTFHLATYFDYFNDVSDKNNKKINDYSYNNLSAHSKIENSNYFIYYDTNSYAAGLNYENHESQLIKSKHNNDFTNSNSNDKLFRYYKTFKTYMLPYSTSEIYQNALQIENNVITEKDKFLFNNKLIEKDLTKTNVYQSSSYSIQYLLHNIQPEQCDITEDVLTDLFGDTTINNSLSSWCIVIQLDDEIGSTLIEELHSINKEKYTASFTLNNNSNNSLIKYYKKHVYINLSKLPSSGKIPEDIDKNYTVVKKFKIITDASVGTNIVHYLISPLHFWETNEINTLLSELNNKDITRFGRKTNLYNTVNSTSSLSNSWYGLLNDSTHIHEAANDNIYDIFLIDDTAHNDASIPPASTLERKIDITGNVISNPDPDKKYVPYTTDYLKNTSMLNNANTFLFSLTSHKLLNNQLTQSNPVYKFKSTMLENLDNNYLLQKSKYHYMSESYFDNNLTEAEKKQQASLTVDVTDTNLFLNEKIYFSNCKNVLSSGTIKDTTIDFVYKINNMYIENDEIYSVIELKALHNNFTLLKKNRILEDTLIYNIDNSSKLRVNEESLLENAKLYSESTDFTSPYFEIDLSGNLSSDDSVAEGVKIKQIPYSHYSFDYEYEDTNPSNDEIDDFVSSDDARNLNTGSPIYKLSESPIGYSSKEEQENKTKDFFYGFSRGKNRYPIERLDGFKYGVESGSKKSLNYHYNNRSFGNASDKIMGSSNYASTYLNNNGVTTFVWPVEKKFVNEHFQYVLSSDALEFYNKDKYSRSTHPYIEDETNILSQYYVAT